MSDPSARREAAIAAALFLLALAFQLPIADRWIAYTDEGLVLQSAAEIIRGKVLYRDVIIPGPGPVAFYLLAGVFRLVGPSLAASRLTIALLSSAMAPLVYLLTRAAASRRAAVLAGLAFIACRLWAFPHWLFFHYSTCAVFLATLAAVLLVRGLGRDRLGPTAVAGAVGGLALLCRQDVGAAGLAGLGAAALLAGGRRRLEHAAALAGGAVLVGLPVLVLFVVHGALDPLVDQTVLTPFRGRVRGLADVLYLRRPALLPLLGGDPALRARMAEYSPAILVTLHWEAITQSPLYASAAWDTVVKLAYFLPAAVLAIAALVVAVGWRRTAARARIAAVVLLFHGAALLAAFNPPQDWVHLLVLYHPTLALGALLLDRVGDALGSARRVVLGAATAAVATSLVVAFVLMLDVRAVFRTPVDTPAGTVYLKPHEARVLDGVLAYVARESPPGDPLPVMPYHPVLQFLALRPAGLSSFYFWPVRPRGDTDARLIRELETSRPRVLLYSPSQYGDLGTFRDRFPALFDHLVERWTIARTFTPPTPWGIVFCALAPRPHEPRAPLLDLAARLDEATVSTEGRVVVGADRDGVAGRTAWPFRRVLYERPAHPGDTRITWTLRVPPGARLRFAYGFNPDRWVSLAPSAVTFTVRAMTPGEEERVLFRAVVDAQRDPGDREWREADVDLGALAGRDVALSLGTEADAPRGTQADLAGWSDVRLTDG